jgi:excinuclease UvrABC nuclease subunit
VQAALAFLAGQTAQPLCDLEQQMHQAARQQLFERAASLRDAWNDLTWLTEQLARLRHAQEKMSFIYPLLGWNGCVTWYLIHGARVVGCVPAPNGPEEASRAIEQVSGVYGRKKLAQLLAPYEHHDGRLIVMQWFRQKSRERKKTLTPDQAQAICRRLLARSA